ncbi:hypothetical protein KEM52_003587 [Ascosphaera acerosa]|nr:hypothetical protein KEM52_003587 [Ascosphaera acerosa]
MLAVKLATASISADSTHDTREDGNPAAPTTGTSTTNTRATGSADDDRPPQSRARTRAARAPLPASVLKKQLEEEFLTPSPRFSPEWLNLLQSRWETPLDHALLLDLAPTQSRSLVRFTREGLAGRVTGYREVTVPAHSAAATAKNSTSMLRRPGARTDGPSQNVQSTD